jgi:hypothetical protein
MTGKNFSEVRDWLASTFGTQRVIETKRQLWRETNIRIDCAKENRAIVWKPLVEFALKNNLTLFKIEEYRKEEVGEKIWQFVFLEGLQLFAGNVAVGKLNRASADVLKQMQAYDYGLNEIFLFSQKPKSPVIGYVEGGFLEVNCLPKTKVGEIKHILDKTGLKFEMKLHKEYNFYDFTECGVK